MKPRISATELKRGWRVWSRRKKLLKELEELGVEPDRLEEEIKRLEEEIESRIREAWKLLPEELNKGHGSRK